MGAGPYRAVALGPRAVAVEARADGASLVRSTDALSPYPRKLSERLEAAAAAHPERIFLAQRDERGEWRSISYRDTLAAVRRIGAALLARGLSSERPIAILSEASIEHALLALAAMHVGVLFAPVSPAYSLASQDLGRLRHVLQLLTPGLVFVQHGRAFGRALAEAVPADCEIVAAAAPPRARRATPFEELARTAAGAAVDAAAAAVGPDTIAKVLFTSGSTGAPKGVINTQRMLCSNQQMFLEALPFIAAQPPVLVEWLPWHHASGGNQILGMTLYTAGTLYIDGGRPGPEGMPMTVRNLREIAPTLYCTVPRAYSELIPYLRADRELQRSLFSRVGMFYYSGASLSAAVIAELDEIALAACGERIPMLCGYGSTETAAFALCANWTSTRAGLAGLPVPGVELKLVPQGGKLEARIRGPNITPGYWRQDELTRALFDAEGFVRTGDALAWVDPQDPAAGLAFDGRLAEDFKLTSGTWVSTATLRARLIAAASPCVQDAVIAGENRDEVVALVFPDLAACRARFCRAGEPADLASICAGAAFRAHLQDALDRLWEAGTGSSTVIARALAIDEPPSVAAGEITDKGSLNQRAVLRHRAAALERLYAQPPDAAVYVAGARPRAGAGAVSRRST